MCCLKQQSATRALRYRRDQPNLRYPPHEPGMPPPPPDYEPLTVVDEDMRLPVVQAHPGHDSSSRFPLPFPVAFPSPSLPIPLLPLLPHFLASLSPGLENTVSTSDHPRPTVSYLFP
ncbi:hypothetical protein CONLIGDRAFT_640014 [Coniochaeta ligniaria NRRL 30616]|uniref:Uncharacterized protein n=1 Tax=Coniochaeta ligniaria NRRL 30616 TaxID=1408157 RepID=A0A1J7JYE1_9PEZI|nr:hypothetical protein CONLIGDRAFT_640014 [Coniochaeta ligniaria NRRL 30616]